MTESIIEVTLDEATIRYRNPEIKHEREMAITDLLHQNSFKPHELKGKGPYKLHLSSVDQRLFMSVKSNADEGEGQTIILSMRSFRKLIKDYFMMWEAYSDGISTHTPEKIQALDMGRRAVHNEGAEMLISSLESQVEVCLDTARRIFTLICILHLK
ncbi:MAG: UPF0262 family protein [Rickettsiales bacterium]|nr:UPF0262 family protein [Rickettsiales bacterium]